MSNVSYLCFLSPTAAAPAAVIRVPLPLLVVLPTFVGGSSRASKSGGGGGEVAVEAAAGGDLRRSHAPHQHPLPPAAAAAFATRGVAAARWFGCTGATALLRSPSLFNLSEHGSTTMMAAIREGALGPRQRFAAQRTVAPVKQYLAATAAGKTNKSGDSIQPLNTRKPPPGCQPEIMLTISRSMCVYTRPASRMGRKEASTRAEQHENFRGKKETKNICFAYANKTNPLSHMGAQ